MELGESRRQVYALFEASSQRLRNALRFVKIFFILLGSLGVGVAAMLSSANDELSGYHWLGLAGALLVFLGGIAVLFLDADHTDALEKARVALDAAGEIDAENQNYAEYLRSFDLSVRQLRSLYFGLMACRGVLEQALRDKVTDETKLINVCLESSRRNFRAAFGFELDSVWTICIYRLSEPREDQRRYLQCIAHHRSIECDISNAREWAEGVGVAGIAVAKNDEVVAPDLLDDRLGTVYRFDNGSRKPEDEKRYRSAFAVPISVNPTERPWGAIIATSDRPNHFGSSDSAGVPPEEAARALAGIVALAISACEFKPSAAKST